MYGILEEFADGLVIMNIHIRIVVLPLGYSGSLECVFGYTDMSDTRSHIYGGRLNDVSFTVSVSIEI